MAGEKNINLNSLPEDTGGKTLQEIIESDLKKTGNVQDGANQKNTPKTSDQTKKGYQIPNRNKIEVSLDMPDATRGVGNEKVILGKDPEPEELKQEKPKTEAPKLKTPLDLKDPIIPKRPTEEKILAKAPLSNIAPKPAPAQPTPPKPPLNPETPEAKQERKFSELQSKLTADAGESETITPSKPVDRKSSIRTYAGDISSLISKGLSVTDVAVEEQKKKEKGPIPPPKEARGNKFIAFAAVLFILLGIGAGGYAAYIFVFENQPVHIEEIPSIIFANNDIELPIATGLEGDTILRSINGAREGVQNTLGAVTNIYMTKVISVDPETGKETKSIIGAREFMTRIDVSTKASYQRALGDSFMLGVHSFDGNKAFLLFEIDDFENALPGILDWERFILDDLWQMFYNQKPVVATEEQINPNAPEITSSTTAPRRLFVEKGFEDIIIKNRDTRVLKDENGNEILIYSFPDRGHLVITTDRTTLIEVFDRLTTSRAGN